MSEATVAGKDAEEILAEVTGGAAEPGQAGPAFTLELNQDQKDIREWVHGFAAGVVRPDETGLTLPIANEELFWGDGGIGMAIMGTSLAVAAIFGQGTPEQMGEW